MARFRKLGKAWATGALLLALLAGTLTTLAYFQQIRPAIAATIDFGTNTGRTIEPVWDAIAVWDVDQITGWIRDGKTPADYRQEHPGYDTLVLMTFTGGRTDRWHRANDYVHRYPNGSLYYDFTNFTAALDWCVAGGFKLEVVLGNTPHALGRPNETAIYGAFEALTGPPANYTEYRWYMQNLTRVLVDRYGAATSGSWEYRLYTEPDGHGDDGTYGWWSGGDEGYVRLWNETFSILKARLPAARLVLGNIIKVSEPAFAGYVLSRINVINASLLPDVVSFSYYNDLIDPPEPQDLVEKFDCLALFLAGLGIGKEFDLSVEEGFIINDENGNYLGGDGTELGAAWMAWMIRSCHDAAGNVTRFTHWGTNMDEYLCPSGYVQLMAARMAGEQLVDVAMDYRNPLIQPGLKLVDGIASKNASGTHFAAMFYQFLPWRDMRRTATVDGGLPRGERWLAVQPRPQRARHPRRAVGFLVELAARPGKHGNQREAARHQ
jgi:hypothetical protein